VGGFFARFGIPLQVLGYLFLYIGLLRFDNKRENKTLFTLFYLIFFGAYFYNIYYHNSISGRAIVGSAAFAVVLFALAYELFFNHNKGYRVAAWFTGSAMLLHGCFLAVRIGSTLVSAPIQSYADMAPIHIAAFLVPNITSILWTFGFILMVNQRLNEDIIEDQEAYRAMRRKAEAERAALADKSRQLEKAESLGRMAGAIAHHFNNQLQAVMSNLELIKRGPQGSGLEPRLDRAKQAVDRAALMSRLMLVYLGQAPGSQVPRFLAGICREAWPDLQAGLPAAVTLEADLPDPGPVISAAAALIQEALGNLVTNAWEALDGAPGSIGLELTTCPAAEVPTAHRFPINWQPQAPFYACLAVADTGCGISEADLEKVFDPFFSTKFTGRGLGLPVVLGIVQAHGGAVAVASRPGQGTVVRAYFPECKASDTPPRVEWV